MRITVKNVVNTILKKVMVIMLAFTLVLSLFPVNAALGAASSSTTSNTTRVSVHDPSIYYDSTTNQYYVFGSHLAQASSTDLRNWTNLGTQGYANTSLYAEPTYEGYYYIKNKNSGLYLDVKAGAVADGTNIQQNTYQGNDAQKFKIVYNQKGYYYILSGASAYNSCVNLSSDSSANGINIEQRAFDNKKTQLFKIKQNSDGSVTFLTKASGSKAAIDVAGKSKSSGANVIQGTYKESDNQKWELVKAGATGNPSRSTGAPLITALATTFAWAGYNDKDSRGGTSVWAPDVMYNPYYAWADGSMGAYMIYYCTSSTYCRSAIGYGVSKSVTGPFQYVDTIVYSGFTSTDTKITTESGLGTKTVNICYKNTNIPELIDNGTLAGINNDWFENGNYKSRSYPNAIDPNVIFDKDGNLWMTYGSWSGGIFTLQLNNETGQPIHPGTNSENTDAYFGKKISGGLGHSGEAPYIVYDKASDYYYLYVSYCWLGVNGGYQIRLFRSTTINGTYTDAAGNTAIYTETGDMANQGIKLFGNYDLSSLRVGYKSGGHNSAMIDTDGQRYLVYHTRFDSGTEQHQVRIHQQFLNEDNWPVTAVYEYLGSTISSKGYTKNDMCGTYQFINMGKDAQAKNVGMISTQKVKLNTNGTITGDVTGKWSYTLGTYYCTMVIKGVTYKGVFFKQKNESSKHTKVMTFSLIGSNNQCIWGSK